MQALKQWEYSLHKLLLILARQVFVLESVLDEWWGLYVRLFYKYGGSAVTRLFVVCCHIKQLFLEFLEDFYGVGSNCASLLQELFLTGLWWRYHVFKR